MRYLKRFHVMQINILINFTIWEYLLETNTNYKHEYVHIGTGKTGIGKKIDNWKAGSCLNCTLLFESRLYPDCSVLY